MNTCYIVCALDSTLDFIPDQGDFVIGADRGYEILKNQQKRIDLVVGDFDSLGKIPTCENIIKFPVKKDDTDSALAIKHAVSLGYKKIVVYGAIGGCLDHTIANLAHIANYTEKGVDISFIDNENIIFALHNSSISFSSEASGRISVFSFNDNSEGVFEKGLLYELDNYTLTNQIPLGVSNEFIGKKAEISVSNGTLIIYTSKNNIKYLTK